MTATAVNAPAKLLMVGWRLTVMGNPRSKSHQERAASILTVDLIRGKYERVRDALGTEALTRALLPVGGVETTKHANGSVSIFSGRMYPFRFFPQAQEAFAALKKEAQGLDALMQARMDGRATVTLTYELAPGQELDIYQPRWLREAGFKLPS